MTTPSLDPLHVRRDGGTLWVSLDHGKANEVGSEVLEAFERLVDVVTGDEGIRALITTSRRTTSRGTPIFVAGADVTERVGWDDDRVLAHVRWQRGVLARVQQLPVLHVVVVHGVAFGWGTEYLLTGDVRLATPTARFALPETGLGIVPGAGGTAQLADEIGVAQALRLGMTGEEVGAAEAAALGLVQELHDDLDAAEARAGVLAARVATRSPTAVAAFKAAVRDGRGASLAARTELEDAAYAQAVRSGDAAVGRAHFADIRAGQGAPWGPRRGD